MVTTFILLKSLHASIPKAYNLTVTTGEFGIVYKGLLMDWNHIPVQGVAVKTLKGTPNINEQPCMTTKVANLLALYIENLWPSLDSYSRGYQ